MAAEYAVCARCKRTTPNFARIDDTPHPRIALCDVCLDHYWGIAYFAQ